MARLSLGGMFVVAVTLVLAGVGRIGTVSAGPQAVVFGTLCGTIVAVGGAWKDAPIEGWSTRAFFRSPIAGALVTILVSACAVTGISAFTGATDSTTLFFVCLGGERLTVESYKAFVRGKVPSKFFIKTVALEPIPRDVVARSHGRRHRPPQTFGSGSLNGFEPAVATSQIMVPGWIAGALSRRS